MSLFPITRRAIWRLRLAILDLRRARAWRHAMELHRRHFDLAAKEPEQ
jgi:hypothetical protein